IKLSPRALVELTQPPAKTTFNLLGALENYRVNDSDFLDLLVQISKSDETLKYQLQVCIVTTFLLQAGVMKPHETNVNWFPRICTPEQFKRLKKYSQEKSEV